MVKAREGFHKRVFDIDIERCPYCRGTLKIIAAIADPSVIAKILDNLGLPTSHLRCAPALRTPASLVYPPKPSLA